MLALGSNTPFEHLFNSLPLYGNQRLQSRNMITVATAAVVLFAGWLDRSDDPPARFGPTTRFDRVVALVPFAIVGVLALWALTATGSLVHVFAGVTARPAVTSTVRKATVIALVFCAGAAALVWIRPRLSRVPWAGLAAVFVAVDVGLMAVTSQLTTPPPNDLLTGTTPIEQLMAAHLVPGGRMVNYDPQSYSSYPGSPQGIPDLNVIPRLPSVSGYASIVNGNYETATNTHQQDDLDIGELSSGTLDRLDLQEVVTVPEYFLVPLLSLPRAIDDVTQVPEGFGADPVLERGYGADFNDTSYPFYPGPRPPLRSGQTASWYFGESLEPSAATLVLAHAAAAGTTVRFGTLAAGGATRWGPLVPVGPDSTVTGKLPSGPAVGLSVQVFGALPSQRAVITVGGQPYELGGSLSSALVPGPWKLAGFSQGYAVFSLRKPPMPISASTAHGRRLPVEVLSSTTKSEQVKVDAPGPSTIIRSVAWDSGWTATVSVDGANPKAVSVDAFDLVQQVHIPGGHVVVTFHYRPPHLLVASILSLGSIALLLALLARWLVRRRRSLDHGVPVELPEMTVAGVPERVG